MGKYLVIVESPTKAKTISAILGKQYDVASSMGHVVDLPSRSLSISIEDDFEPTFKVIRGKEKILSTLKKKAKGKEAVYLATDPDREGEAISWHIKDKLSKATETFYRVVFHEITESAIKEAFRAAGQIDVHKVNAQKARRILDRLVGYFLSPLLWKKISRGLSAGRVQSIALKFIAEREKEINAFIPVTTYEVEAVFNAGTEDVTTRLKKRDGKKASFNTKKAAQSVIDSLKRESFSVLDVSRRSSKRKPPAPFTTSLLQQDAFNKLRFSSKKTMLLAQHLYEGVQINGTMTGLITYMRTDSYHVADKAKKSAKAFISSHFGAEYVTAKEYRHKHKKTAQLAHEAIRPTDTALTPQEAEQYLNPDEHKLYELIWKRFVSSFMKEAEIEYSTLTIGNDRSIFTADGKRIVFDGFLKVSGAEEEKLLPDVEKGEAATLGACRVLEKTTRPPARFTDASLVKLLEEKGIGRPSTYVPTIFTLILRNYVRREKGYFIPTELGMRVCELLVGYFSEIMDENFTAQIEEKLDGVEEGKVDGTRILKDFFPSFREKIEVATKEIKKHIEYVDKECPRCGKPLMIKWSRRGRFLSCSGYPACKYAESITTGVACPECGKGELIERRNRRGQYFYGCSNFPACRFTSRSLPKPSETPKDGVTSGPDAGAEEEVKDDQ